MKRGPIHRRLVPPQAVSGASTAEKKPLDRQTDAAPASGAAAKSAAGEDTPSEDKTLLRQKIIERIKAQQRAQAPAPTEPAETSRPRSRSGSESSSSAASKSGDGDDEDAIAARRRALVERLRAKRAAERASESVEQPSSSAGDEILASDVETPKDAEVKAEPSEESVGSSNSSTSSASSSSDGEDESSSSSSDSDDDSLPMPSFVPRKAREEEAAEREREQLQREAQEEEARELRHREALRVMERALQEEAIAERRAREKQDDTRFGLRPGRPDDTDGLDEEAEYAAWKEREMHRLAKEYSISI